MAFFEKLGKKLSDVGQAAAKQTKNITEITKLSAANADRSRKINQLYAAIGEAYYKNHKEDVDAECFAQIAEINTLAAEIAAAQEEIKQIKGIVNCPNCNAEVSSDNAFCNACGAKIEKPEAVAEDVVVEDFPAEAVAEEVPAEAAAEEAADEKSAAQAE